jgi:hypothetical protein
MSLVLLLSSCASKNSVQKSAVILIKTPALKFYDTGFITQNYSNIKVSIFNAGQAILNLTIYEDRICQSTFKCLSSPAFNQQYLHESYEDNFMYKLFSSKKINFKDRKNKISIKVINN